MQNTNEMKLADEEEIIRKAKTDISYFKQLYENYYLDVFRFVYCRVEDNAKASEIASDIFLKAMENIKQYTSKGIPFINWLIVISRNEVNMYYRKEKKERKYFINTDSILELKEELEEEENETISYDKIINILETLPEKEYELFHLKHFDKKSFREISEITKINEVNLRVKFHRIKSRLRDLILNEGLFATRKVMILISVLFFISIFKNII